MHLKNHDFDRDGYNDSHDNDEDAVSDASKSSIAKAIEHVYVLEHKTFALAISLARFSLQTTHVLYSLYTLRTRVAWG